MSSKRVLALVVAQIRIYAFVNEVNAQVQGGMLSQTQATPLIAAANRIKAVLGCQ
jgi:hypothetical protein